MSSEVVFSDEDEQEGSLSEGGEEMFSDEGEEEDGTYMEGETQEVEELQLDENIKPLEEKKVLFGKNRRNQMFKAKTPAKISKKKANCDEDASNGETSEDYSSSETEGEIEIPIEMDITDDKQDEEKIQDPHKLPNIQMPQGEQIPVVSIKQEYDEDEEIFFRDEEMDGEATEDRGEEPKVRAKENQPPRKKKGKPEVTVEDLAKINVRFCFTCQLCNEKCGEDTALSIHMQKSHSDQIGTYMCATCQRVYQTVEHLRAHMLCHVQLGTYECPDCKKIYHHPASLLSHRRRWHRKEGQPYECTECGKSFGVSGDLKTHMKSHIQETFSCKYCDKAFRTDRYLRLHTRHVHFGHKHLKIECKICHKSFQKKSMLSHMKIHQIGKVHRCHYCGKCVTTHYSLMAHIRRHEGIKPFICHICDKGFVDKGKLARHVNTHSGARNFQCDICNKSFTERQYLRQHRRIHEDTKDYPCRVCGTVFKSMNSVWSHMRKHTQSNRYKCNQCGKTCYRPDHLRSHMVSHTGVKEYQCEICSKRFAKSYDLTEHMRGHSGEKPYTCSLCDRAFARHGEFRKHRMSKYHREREIEAGMTPAFPPLPPRSAKGSGAFQCGTCEKRFTTQAGLMSHLRRKTHVAKEPGDNNRDTYHDQEGFEEDRDEKELQSIPALQELSSHRSLDQNEQEFNESVDENDDEDVTPNEEP